MLLRATSLADTHVIAASLAGIARVGDIIVLAGEMGAGKTAFAQGFGRALGVTEHITSPTFTLVHSYPCADGKITLHHADIYRLDSTGDVDELALPELAEFGGIVLVEWGDVAAAGFGDHLEVRLEHEDDEHGDDEHDDGATEQGTEEGTDEFGTDEFGTDEFGTDAARLIAVQASGPSWAGRWERVSHALAGFRC